MNDKMTKKDWYSIIKDIVNDSDYENKSDVIDFIDKQINQLDRKAEKAKEAAQERKLNGDEMRDAIYHALTDEFATIDEICERVTFEGITRSKVATRLSQLVKYGNVEKNTITTEDKRRLNVYRLEPTPENIEDYQ